MDRPARVGRALGLSALVVGGAALGFAAERALVHRRISRGLPTADESAPLGSIAGRRTTVAGPDNLAIAVETYGPERTDADAPQVLLSHAWICTRRAWHHQVRELAQDHRVITYDHPGHGHSTAPASSSYDLDVLGDTLVAVIEQAVHPGPFVVAGHSLGGMTVLNAVRRHPQVFADRLRGAVLIATTSSARSERLGLELGIRGVARLERGIRRLVPTLRDPRLLQVTDRLTAATSDLSYLVTRWTAAGPEADPAVVAFTQQLALDSGADVVLGLIEAVLGVDEDDGLERLVELGVPTTVIGGVADRVTPIELSRRMAARAGIDLVEVERAGHMVPLEAPDEVNEVLRRYLGGGAARAGSAA